MYSFPACVNAEPPYRVTARYRAHDSGARIHVDFYEARPHGDLLWSLMGTRVELLALAEALAEAVSVVPGEDGAVVSVPVGVVEGGDDELEHRRGGEVDDALAGGVELVEPGGVGPDDTVLVEGHAQGR